MEYKLWTECELMLLNDAKLVHHKVWIYILGHYYRTLVTDPHSHTNARKMGTNK